MNNFTYSNELEQALSAPLVEQINTSDSSKTIYMGFPCKGDLTRCAIKKVVYSKNGTTESWTTTWANGMKEQNVSWADRGTLTFLHLK